jgi:exonuclease III
MSKIATLNINGIPAPSKVGKLSEYITRHELDKLFVQKVRNPETLNIGGFETHNIRKSMPITILQKLHSGRAMSAEYSGIRLTNVYATSD